MREGKKYKGNKSYLTLKTREGIKESENAVREYGRPT